MWRRTHWVTEDVGGREVKRRLLLDFRYRDRCHANAVFSQGLRRAEMLCFRQSAVHNGGEILSNSSGNTTSRLIWGSPLGPRVVMTDEAARIETLEAWITIVNH